MAIPLFKKRERNKITKNVFLVFFMTLIIICIYSTDRLGLPPVAEFSVCSRPRVRLFSQSNEDVGIWETYYKTKEVEKCNNGTFVEIGALDGIRYSNSYWYEYAVGWRSILIEANPKNYETLVYNRPNAVTVHAAICSQNATKFVLGKGRAVGGVAATVTEKYVVDWTINKTIDVPCRLLGSILRENKVNHIDVFSVDVEGGELALLETMDWSIPVDIWLVELDGNNELKDVKVRELLLQNGYVRSNVNIQKFCGLYSKKECAANELFERREWRKVF